ncbi:hypothetical protein NPX13_g6134 [Xylaria arbuscula]|uniref:Uncharacterized protein n=1 Tax=Xylaria arbuscula TaxID=114810 RepID=A0A9W8TMF6_9PEZI|nr:hypothetical protein NPX13_g6134 [Xylaria arbuscula]
MEGEETVASLQSTADGTRRKNELAVTEKHGPADLSVMTRDKMDDRTRNGEFESRAQGRIEHRTVRSLCQRGRALPTATGLKKDSDPAAQSAVCRLPSKASRVGGAVVDDSGGSECGCRNGNSKGVGVELSGGMGWQEARRRENCRLATRPTKRNKRGSARATGRLATATRQVKSSQVKQGQVR